MEEKNVKPNTDEISNEQSETTGLKLCLIKSRRKLTGSIKL